jgi:plastocyanin
MTEDDGETVSRRALMRAAAGGALAGAAGAAGTASAQEATETATATGTATATEGSSGGGGGGGYTWTVEMTDENVYEPDSIKVRPGDTVVWENVGTADHSVTAYQENIPDGANYWASGGFGSEEAARSSWPEGAVGGGETYEYTFETEGTHEYFCIPHEAVGMVGSVEVTPDAPTPTPTPAPAAPALPTAAKAVGVGATAAMISTLGLAYAFIKYGGSGGEE